MAQNPQDPQPQPDQTSSRGMKSKHRYNGLVVGGALTALLFLLFTLVGGVSIDGTINPLWIGVILGVMVTGLGIFRVLRGPTAFGLGDVEHEHQKP